MIKNIICLLPVLIISILTLIRNRKGTKFYNTKEEAAEHIAASLYATVWTAICTVVALILLNI